MFVGVMAAALAAICSPSPAVRDRSEDAAALAQINAGWIGSWEEIHSVSATEDFSGWEESTGGPFSRFTIAMRGGPRASAWELGNGTRFTITLEPGLYVESREKADGEAGPARATKINGAEVRSTSDWRFWLLHTNAVTGAVEECSEVYMAGDVLVWANWLQMDDEVRRVRYSISKRKGGVPALGERSN